MWGITAELLTLQGLSLLKDYNRTNSTKKDLYESVELAAGTRGQNNTSAMGRIS